MLIHLVPRFYNSTLGAHVELLDVTIPEIRLVLRGGADILARRPYPNKCYLVASRMAGRKAMCGLLIETPLHLASCTSITRWAINAERVVTHEVEHLVLDKEHAAVTDEMLLWYGHRCFANRWPAGLYPNSAPLQVQPRMALVVPARLGAADRQGADFTDDIASDGILVRRRERFRLPTIEPSRLAMGPETFAERVPPLQHAFRP